MQHDMCQVWAHLDHKWQSLSIFSLKKSYFEKNQLKEKSDIKTNTKWKVTYQSGCNFNTVYIGAFPINIQKFKHIHPLEKKVMMALKKSSAIRNGSVFLRSTFSPICYLLSPSFLIPCTGPLTFLQSFSLLVFSEFVCVSSHIRPIHTV